MNLHCETGVADDTGGHLDRRPQAPDPKFELVHPETLRFFPELVQDLGGDAAGLLQQTRIDPFIFSRRDAVLEYRSFVQLLELGASQLGRPDLGLRLAQVQAANRVMGPVGVVMRNSATVGQALGYCAKHIHAYSLATRVRFKPDRANHRLFIGLELLLERAPQAAQAMEHGLLLAHKNIMEISGSRARARSVSFRHPPLSPTAAYRAAFGCDVLFGQAADGIVLTEDDLLCPIVEADEQIYEMATSFIDARYPHALPPLQAQVRALVAKTLSGPDCTNERIAADLCMHPRTLQRRLRADDASFEGIKDGVRREMAIHLLQRTMLPLAHVAEKLGYAEASVLSRSCFRWFGAPPLQIRKGTSALEACAAVA